MMQHAWWILEAESRARVGERLAEAEHDRLVRSVAGPARSPRRLLAGALRAAARRLDGEVGSAGGRRLAAAR